MTEEGRMNNVGINTLDVLMEPDRNRLRTSNMEVNAHTSIPIVDVLLPSGHGDHVKIPHVNLSITGYESDSLRTLAGMRSPSMRTQEISVIPQLDGPRSLLRRETDRGRMNEVPRLVELESSQGGTYVQRPSALRRREYPGGDGDDDNSRRQHRDWRPPEGGRYPDQGGRPPDQGGYPDRGPPCEQGPPR